MGYPFIVRRATVADKADVLELVRAVDPEDWIPYVYDHFMAQAPPTGLYLAEQEGRLIGCYHLEVHGNGDTYFSAMRIAVGMQGKGVGTLLCRAQVEQARGMVDGDIYLLSRTQNLPAHKMAFKNGFERLGEWVVYGGVALSSLELPAPRQARAARVTDLPMVERFRAGRSSGPLQEMICTPESGWAVRRIEPTDWSVDSLVVVEGDEALAGYMLLSFSSDEVLIRQLDGSLEAAAELLAYAVHEATARGCRELELGLPALCEPLLKPLGFAPEQADPSYLFCLPSNKPLPDLAT